MLCRLWLLLGSALLFGSCAPDLHPSSSLIEHQLVRNERGGFDGVWSAPGLYEHMRSGTMYFSPLDTSFVREKYPQEATLLQTKMHDDIVRYAGEALHEHNQRFGGNWKLTESRANATLVVDMKIVKLEPTKGGANLLGFIGSFFSPVPGTSTALSQFTKGSIGIEGRILNISAHQPIFDTNKDETIIFSFNDYGHFGHSEESLSTWAKRLATLPRSSYAQA